MPQNSVEPPAFTYNPLLLANTEARLIAWHGLWHFVEYLNSIWGAQSWAYATTPPRRISHAWWENPVQVHRLAAAYVDALHAWTAPITDRNVSALSWEKSLYTDLYQDFFGDTPELKNPRKSDDTTWEETWDNAKQYEEFVNFVRIDVTSEDTKSEERVCRRTQWLPTV